MSSCNLVRFFNIFAQAWKETEELRAEYDRAEDMMDPDLRDSTQRYDLERGVKAV